MCQRTSTKITTKLMGQLPGVHVLPTFSNERVSVDYAGPLTLKVGSTLRPTYLKAYATVAHKDHYALFYNTFWSIKYAFQIMHNILWIHYKLENLRNTFRNLHNTFARGPQVLAEKKETVTQLLSLPSTPSRSNSVLNAGRSLQITKK